MAARSSTRSPAGRNLEPERDHHHLRRVRWFLRSRAAAYPLLRSGRTAAGTRHPHPDDRDLALLPRACRQPRRRRPQRGDRNDRGDLRPAALASLPDEKAALLAGEDPKFNGPNGFVQHHLGPRDLNTPETDDLLSASIQAGCREAAVLPASYAINPGSSTHCRIMAARAARLSE